MPYRALFVSCFPECVCVSVNFLHGVLEQEAAGGAGGSRHAERGADGHTAARPAQQLWWYGQGAGGSLLCAGDTRHHQGEQQIDLYWCCPFLSSSCLPITHLIQRLYPRRGQTLMKLGDTKHTGYFHMYIVLETMGTLYGFNLLVHQCITILSPMLDWLQQPQFIMFWHL